MFRNLLEAFERKPWLLPLVALPMAVLALRAMTPDTRAPLWWTIHALVKIRPNDTVPETTANRAEIAAARNEFEPFQIVLRPESSDLNDTDAEASDLRGPHGAIIGRENVHLYLEEYEKLEHTSGGGGESAGEWPDPLVPRVDQYAGERRNAFPFRVRAGTNQPIWVEVYVPPETPPGRYDGRIQITADRIVPIVVPFQLLVRSFTLPSTSSFQTSFGLSGINVLKQHRGRYTSDEDLLAITKLYAKATLWHRITVHGGTFLPPRFMEKDGKAQIGWTAYDAEVAPFLNGEIFTKGEPLYGAKFSSIDLRTSNEADTDELKVKYWRAWVQHFVERGWLDRLFLYAWDEPQRTDLLKVAHLAGLAKQADPRLAVLVTTSYEPSMAAGVDIWAPLINCVDAKPGYSEYCDRSVSRRAYDPVLSARKTKLWWYQSCASHGCKSAGGSYFEGWPSYLIDRPAVDNRIMPWISWKYRISGELYYNMAEAPDPWHDVYLFGGNGDGTLFYPGTPSRIGGHTDIPIESIRLKLIREGLEDYEYLKLLASRGDRQLANEFDSELVRAAYDFEKDPEVLYSVRKSLGDALDQRRSPSTTPATFPAAATD
jgi:glycosyl hydrolase family 123